MNRGGSMPLSSFWGSLSGKLRRRSVVVKANPKQKIELCSRRLRLLEELRQNNIISDNEYFRKRREVFAEI
jgi:hypothetical protein